MKAPVCLIIMDGYGIDAESPINAISLAETPVLDRIFSECPHTALEASGEAVGLPEGQMGNSEVGHLNIGAGRVVYQELTRINRACRNGSLADNAVLLDAMDHASAPGAALHLMGLLSDGGVHSNNQHLYALVRMAVERGVKDVRIHCFLDGRDVPPASGKGYVEDLLEFIEGNGYGEAVRIASVQGRYYGMDRDNRWDRIERGYDAIVCGTPIADCMPAAAVQASYDAGVTDEFVEPLAFDGRGIADGDSVLFFNFRPDRARQITRAINEDAFDGFERKRCVKVNYVCFTEYDPSFGLPVAFKKEFPEQVLADVIADAGLRQYHIAETEKYAHVTFFLNGGIEDKKEGERRVLIPSPKVATYDLQPEMSAPEVATTLAEAIENDEADFYIVNFANCDMVGHTGVIPAAVAAVQAVDDGVGKVLGALREKGGIALLTADHGNADKMVAADGSPHTAHTTAPVPLALIDYSGAGLALSGTAGSLCDIAPTLLEIAGLAQPEAMTGRSLLA